jgi:DNA excision repair protein ERCC-4
MLILVDTREKKPWNFQFFNATSESRCLKTGDYTLEGFEDKFCVDRKYGAGEIYMCLYSQYGRFKKELQRMQDFEEAYLVIESGFDEVQNFPACLPARARKKVRFNAQNLQDKIEYVQDAYNVEFIFCDNRQAAEKVTFDLLKAFWEKNR